MLIAAGVVVALLAANTAVLWFRLDRSGGSLAGSPPGGTTWLLIGSDRRGTVAAEDLPRFGTVEEVPGARADVIVAVRINDDGTVQTLGISRDLMLLRPDTGLDRLATTLKNGPNAIADALCHSLGLGADHLAMIEFDGLQALIDLQGGIDVTSDAKVLDRGSGLLLRDGDNRLDGEMALAYVRARSIEVWDGDRWIYDLVRSNQRPERAVEIVSKIARGATPSWKNPIALQRLAWVGTGAVTVDGDTSPFDLLDLARSIADSENRSSQTLPTRPRVGPGAEVVPIDEVVPSTLSAIGDFQGTTPPTACAEPAFDS